LTIGALGKINFNKGFYLYVGSAMGNYGSSTLLNRVKRHLLDKKEKRIHWHIDYLLADIHSKIFKIYLIPSAESLECTIAQQLSKICGSSIKRFGSSDCTCSSHLFYLKSLDQFDKKISNIYPNQNG
jgi:Uri superfamily endonuclease